MKELIHSIYRPEKQKIIVEKIRKNLNDIQEVKECNLLISK
ncbi:hypothetical protein [Carboxylicivirga sp. RSCT41]